MKFKVLFSMSALLLSSLAFAQNIDMEKLSKPVRKFIEASPDATSYRPSCSELEKCINFQHKKNFYSNKDYYRHVKDYKMNISKRELFQTLTTEHPKNIWTDNANFQMLYRPSSQEVFYKDSEGITVEVGDMIFLELIPKAAFLKAKVPVGFQIITLDESKGMLTFSYLTDNKSKGVQQLNVSENQGHVEIVHTSRYRSGSNFRDNHVYEPFHVQFTDNFYINIEKVVKKKR